VQQQHLPSVVTSSLSSRIPTTNGDTQLSPSKPVTTTDTSSPASKHFQSPSPQPPAPPTSTTSTQKLEFRAMRELLADDRRGDFGSLDQLPPSAVEEKCQQQHHDVEMREEKNERESPFSGGGCQQQEPQTIQVTPSPVNLSNDSNSGDGHFDGGNRGEFCGESVVKCVVS
jgi:hypothetical protein